MHTPITQTHHVAAATTQARRNLCQALSRMVSQWHADQAETNNLCFHRLTMANTHGDPTAECQLRACLLCDRAQQLGHGHRDWAHRPRQSERNLPLRKRHTYPFYPSGRSPHKDRLHGKDRLSWETRRAEQLGASKGHANVRGGQDSNGQHMKQETKQRREILGTNEVTMSLSRQSALSPENKGNKRSPGRSNAGETSGSKTRCSSRPHRDAAQHRTPSAPRGLCGWSSPRRSPRADGTWPEGELSAGKAMPPPQTKAAKPTQAPLCHHSCIYTGGCQCSCFSKRVQSLHAPS